MAKLNGLIPPREFEKNRDAIASILATEMAAQYAMNNAYPRIDKVWTERCIAFNEEKDLPTINVGIDRTSFEGYAFNQADGNTLYNVDIYTISDAVDDPDKASMLLMQKIMGMVWAIFSHQDYQTLGFARGTIMSVRVTDMMVLDKTKAKDLLSFVAGRVQIAVQATETTELKDADYVHTSVTTAKLGNTEQGYYYEFIDTTESAS